MANKVVLITGVAGLLGSHLADRYLAENYQVIGVDNLVGGYLDNIPKSVHFYKDDCCDLKKMQQICNKHKPDLIVHAACTAYEGLSVFSPSFVFDNTASATISILSAGISSGMKKFVFCSSMARYGDQGGIQFSEDMDPKPQDPYGIAKVCSEQIIENLSQAHAFDYVILVPHNIIGPRQRYDDPYRNVAAIMINRMLHGLPPIIYGDGLQTRSFSFISDVVEPIYFASISHVANREVINVGPDDNEITIVELAKTIAKLLNFNGEFIHVPDRPQEVKHATCSANKARKLLDYKVQVDLETGLQEMIDFIKESGSRDFAYDHEIEIINSKTPETWTKKLI